MRPEQDQKALDKPPHPMLGWLAAIPLPASHQPGAEELDAASRAASAADQLHDDWGIDAERDL